MRITLLALSFGLLGNGAMADCLDGPLVWVDDPAFVATIDTSDPLTPDAVLRIAMRLPEEHAGALQRRLAEEVATQAALAMGRSGIALAEIAALRAAARNGDYEILRTALFAAPDTDVVISARASFLWSFGCAEAALALADPTIVAAMSSRRFPERFALAQDDPAMDLAIQTAVFEAWQHGRDDWIGWPASYNTLVTWLAYGQETERARLSAALSDFAASEEEFRQTTGQPTPPQLHPAISLFLQTARERGIAMPESIAGGDGIDLDRALGVLSSASTRELQYFVPGMLNFLARMDQCPLAAEISVATLNVAELPPYVHVTAQAALVRCRQNIRWR